MASPFCVNVNIDSSILLGDEMINGRVCNFCKYEANKMELEKNFYICPKCGSYLSMHALKRIRNLTDDNFFLEWDKELLFPNVSNENDYISKLVLVAQQHNLNEAIITGEIRINGYRAAIKLEKFFEKYDRMSPSNIVKKRYQRFRKC